MKDDQEIPLIVHTGEEVAAELEKERAAREVVNAKYAAAAERARAEMLREHSGPRAKPPILWPGRVRGNGMERKRSAMLEVMIIVGLLAVVYGIVTWWIMTTKPWLGTTGGIERILAWVGTMTAVGFLWLMFGCQFVVSSMLAGFRFPMWANFLLTLVFGPVAAVVLVHLMRAIG